MPMLIPNPKAISKNIENISKSGINIDDIVRHSINCDIRNILKNDPSNCISTLNRLRSPLKETSLTSVTSTSLRNQRNVMKSSIQKVLVNQANYCDKYQRKEMKYCDHLKKENMGKDEEAFDDSLTSLQWLTGVNVDDILEGKPIQYTPPSPAPSSSSEDGDDKRCFRKDLRYYSDGSVDYRKNHEIKPPYSYAALIIMAMKSKLCGKMTLSEIYKWISDNFIFYRNAEPTWQNSIRHNLSLNKCFTKIPRKKGDPGKGGYWSIVPEFANKLLENSIRKRRSAGYQYCSSSMVKRQRLDMLETQLLSKIKAEMKDDYSEDEKLITKTFLDQISFSERSNDRTPVEILADLEHCRMDHPYGKSPVVNYNVSDEENIRAIASHLQESTSNMDIALQSGQENITIPSNSSMFNSFASAIRTDCIWSSEQSDSMSETMRNVTDELLEARNISSGDNVLLKTLSNSLNSTHSLASSLFCLSPPISGDDDGFSDELDDMDDPRAPFSDDDINLTIHGTSIKLFKPTPEMIETANKCIKEEPLSPDSIDLEG